MCTHELRQTTNPNSFQHYPRSTPVYSTKHITFTLTLTLQSYPHQAVAPSRCLPPIAPRRYSGPCCTLPSLSLLSCIQSTINLRQTLNSSPLPSIMTCPAPKSYRHQRQKTPSCIPSRVLCLSCTSHRSRSESDPP